MRTYLISAALSFTLGYCACNFAIISTIYDFVASVPETTHKVKNRYLLYALLILLALFILILIPLERIANFEARRKQDYPYRTSAREHLQRRGSF
ncbi:hypothetical protein BCR41DRAFT_161621 [Lobosporangium transversale]|uniref:Uncharacterized protein n=1 Tax=Lobosporangium transversale TaxID=64571 RepID=A0A1Y2GEJ2_9FUNG|nr:hypothetical protein BCR41DRAFT_161621 [Lobosporangium transversale]ORZ07246.1 hypothetical protein BCR41DRAFT_161621 [Lobosporangium transversale]|eukprot:XP_021877909.1 hypothetical protein BCR41DRAFT_161621 [Lobosporangium transversale]